ncbi:MAG: hypothetical protein MPJ50_15850, partial [Pirellulales bacterium]|nr:hypothetical protein [Pirellulales bacterium]
IGWGLGKCRNWGRNTAVIDCLIQMGAAITLMSLAESLSPTTGIQFLALFASAWLGAYLRIMFSPITRTACQPEVAKSALADESTRIHGLPRTIAEFAVLLFGFTGGMLTSFCMIALGSLLR